MTEKFTYFNDLATELEVIPEESIISKTLADGAEFKLVLFGFAPGQELSEHTASMPAILQFISGEAEITLGEDSMMAQPNTWVHMEANLPHSVRALTPVSMLLILLKGG
ncbi:cupin domain-containing protein [Chloroflexota bacterium]